MKRRMVVLLLALMTAAVLCRGSLADDGWVCGNCGRTNSPKAAFCGACGTKRPVPGQEPNPEINAWVCSGCGYAVPQEDRFCLICGAAHSGQEPAAVRREEAAGTVSSFEPCEILKYPMRFSGSSGAETIRFRMPADGICHIWTEDTLAGTEYKMQLKDSAGYVLAHNSLYISRPELSKELNAGEYYDLDILYQSFRGSCTVCVGVPRPAQPVGRSAVIRDSMSFISQVNTYSFVTNTAGRCRVEVDELKEPCRIRLKLLDEQGHQLAATSLGVSRGGGVSEKLEAGKTYYIQAIQSEGLSAYQLTIGRPGPALELSGADAAGDSLSYRDQENTYLFRPQVTADYMITARYMEGPDMNVQVRVCDIQGHPIKTRNYFVKDASFSVTLEAGAAYQIIVKQNEGMGEYTLQIGRQ